MPHIGNTTLRYGIKDKDLYQKFERPGRKSIAIGAFSSEGSVLKDDV